MILSTSKAQPQLLVCTQKRSGPNPLCCSNSGSEMLLAELRKAALENNLHIDVVETKCMLLCEDGPNINPACKIWNRASMQTIPQIIDTCKKLLPTS